MSNRTVWLLLGVTSALCAQSAIYPTLKSGGNYAHNYYLPPSPGATPWAPAWSPDGRSLAVSMHGSIWKVDPRTEVAEEITYGGDYHSSPAWSPDGRWLVYTADDGGKRIRLEALEIGAGRRHRLTDDEFVYTDPVFSPDGQWLAYTSTRPNGYLNVFIRRIRDGAWAGEPVPVTYDRKYPRSRLYVGQWDMHTQPAWTPDGRKLVLVANRGMALGSGGLWVAPAVKHGIDSAVSILPEVTVYRSRPHVSPDGRRIVYASTAGGADQFENLWLLPVEGGLPYKLTLDSWDHFHPRWSPGGEWIAFMSNQHGLPQLCLLETAGGELRRVDITRRAWMRPMGRVRVRVLDEAGKTAPAWIYDAASDGKFYTPPDAYARVGRNGRRVIHTGGAFTFEAPAGPLSLEAVKGFEYFPASRRVEVKPSATVTVTLRLKRLVSFAALGWYGGSLHTHMNYGGNLHNTFENLAAMARASAVDVVNTLVANRDTRMLDYHLFEPGGGEHPASAKTGVSIMVGQEYRPPFYGHISLIGLRRFLLNPATTGYESTALDSLYPSNTDILRKAREQGALTAYVHPFGGDGDPLRGGLGGGKAFPVDAALGMVDALEWSWANRSTFPVIAHAWNNGLPIVPVGGEDSISNLHRNSLLGAARTYVHTGSKPDARRWIEGIRKGHTFFSTGPLLDFTVNGKLPGETLALPEQGGSVSLRCRAWSIAPLRRVTLFHNGEPVKEIPLGADGRTASWQGEWRVAGSGWFALLAEGDPHPAIDGRYPQALTNAIRVSAGAQKIRNKASAAYFLRWIDTLERMTRDWPWWRTEKELRHVLAQYDQARAVYRRLMEEAP